MLNNKRVNAIIPALNEEQSIGRVVSAVPDWVDEIVVVDNGSTDGTAKAAKAAGARVVSEVIRGYGKACQSGVLASDSAEILVFLDGDASDFPGEMEALVKPIAIGEADFVLGSRLLGGAQPGSLTPQQRFGNALACTLMKWLWDAPYTDLGPFRAIRRSVLESLRMQDVGYGWTIEMQIKAVKKGAQVREVPVSYRKRIGKSKISGTVTGTIGAGAKILATIARLRISDFGFRISE